MLIPTGKRKGSHQARRTIGAVQFRNAHSAILSRQQLKNSPLLGSTNYGENLGVSHIRQDMNRPTSASEQDLLGKGLQDKDRRESSSSHGVQIISSSAVVSRARIAAISFALIAHYNPPTARFKDIMDGYLKRKSNDLNSQIIYFFNKNTHTGALTFNMELHYPEESLEELMLIVKTEVVRSALEGDKHMAVFDFARDNEQHAIVCGACLIQPPLFDKIAWAYVLILSNNTEAAVAQLTGRARPGMNEIEQRTNCTIEVVQHKTTEAHIYVSGGHAEDVAKCRELLQNKLQKMRYSWTR